MPRAALAFILSALAATSAAAESECSWEPAFVDSAAAAHAPSDFAGLDNLPIRDIVARIGPSAIVFDGYEVTMRWPVDDGRLFDVRASDVCSPSRQRFLGVVTAGVDPASPDGIVREFYRRNIVPTEVEKLSPHHERFSGLLGRELAQAVTAQAEYEAACARIIPPDIKPYMLDQGVFDGTPDGWHALESTAVRLLGNEFASVAVELSYDVDYRLTDTVYLAREAGRWVIVDIRWESGHRLTERLRRFAAYRCGGSG